MRFASLFSTFFPRRHVIGILAMGFMVISTASFAAPPKSAAIVKAQKGQIEKLNKELEATKAKCSGTATASTQGMKSCEEAMKFVVDYANAAKKRHGGGVNLKPVMEKLEAIAADVAKLKKQGGATECSINIRAITAEDDKDIKTILTPKIADACLRATGDTTAIMTACVSSGTVECIRTSNGGWMVRPVSPPFDPAPYGVFNNGGRAIDASTKSVLARADVEKERIAADKAVSLKRLELRLEEEKEEASEAPWAVKWIALPLGTGLLTGGLCAAFWPDVTDDGETHRGNSFGKCMAAGTGLGLIAGGAWEAAD